MVLKEQLKNIRMTKAESVVHYLGRVKQVRDDLTAIGEVVAPTESVKIVVAGLLSLGRSLEMLLPLGRIFPIGIDSGMIVCNMRYRRLAVVG